MSSGGNQGSTPDSQMSPGRASRDNNINTPHSSPGVIPSTPMDFGSAGLGSSQGMGSRRMMGSGMRSPLTPSASGGGGTPHRSSSSSLPRGDVGRNFSARKIPLPPTSQQIPPTPATPSSSPYAGGGGGRPRALQSSIMIGSSMASTMLDDFTQSQSQAYTQQGISQTPGGFDDDNNNNNNNNNNHYGGGGSYGGGSDDHNEVNYQGNIDMMDIGGGDTAANAGATIWGTDIHIETCMSVFREFLGSFNLHGHGSQSIGSGHGGGRRSHYMRILETLHATQQAVLNLDCAHLKEHIPSRRLYSQLIAYPQELIPIFDEVASQEFLRAFGHDPALHGPLPVRIQVRTYNLAGNVRPMRDLNPENIDQLVSLKGLVIRCSPIIPDLKQAFFRCFSCAVTTVVPIERGRIAEPSKCEACNIDNSMELIHNRCLFSDKQLIRLQENINEIPEGETPQTVSLFVFDDLVDSVKPGDRVEVVGIYRAVPHRVNPKMRTVRSIYKTYVDVIHFRQADQSSDGGDSGDTGGTVNDDNIVFPTTPHREKHRRGRVLTHTTPGGTDVYADREGEDDSVLGSGGGVGRINSPGMDADDTGRSSGNDMPRDESRAILYSAERIKEFQEFATRPGESAYDRLTQAFAPSIWEMEDVKRGILCQLFGGTSSAVSKRNKKQERLENRRRRNHALEMGFADADEVQQQQLEEEEDEEEEDSEDEEEDGRGSGKVHSSRGNNIHKRQDVNILLCGDPGTSKSQLLSYVHKITPRGIYTSGKGSSAVGLTASVVRDPETKDMVLESGALVLSDNGICCIDEFDKMSDSTRAILHEAMEQQTVSITKAGIIATLNARTSVLASANPVESRYNPRLSVVANLKLPPTLLSRFDLIYLILDKPNEETDRRLAKHLVSLYYPAAASFGTQDSNTGSRNSNDNGNGSDGGVISQEFLKDYIQYARSVSAPEITADSAEVLVGGYLAMRSVGSSKVGTKTISATPRQLESLIRLAQALAKMRLSAVVGTADVHEAIRLMKVATQAAATDPRTGTIDMDMLSTGHTSRDRETINTLAGELLRLFEARRGERMTLQTIRGMIEMELKENVNLEDLEEALREIPESIAVKIDRTKMVAIK